MKKKNKKGIKAKPWQIFSYYIMPFILGVIAFFGFSKIILSGSNNKLYTLLDLVNKLNQKTMLSLILSLTFIGIGYLIYWAAYTDNIINFNEITSKSIIIPLLAVIMFYFLPNICVFLHNVASILIHDEKYKYTYLLIHVLWSYSIFGLIYYKDKDIVKIMKIHYFFVLNIFILLIMVLLVFDECSFIAFILEHRLRTIVVFWFAFIFPFIFYLSDTDTYTSIKYKDYLLKNDISYGLLIISGSILIGSAFSFCLSDSFTKDIYNLGKTLCNRILKLNSISYIPVILTTLTVMLIGFAIYKTRKQLKD